MRFSTVLFAVGASAALVERQSETTQVILDALSAISDATTSLDGQINEYTGEDQAADLLDGSEAVVAAIQQGTSDVEATTRLDNSQLADALLLEQPTTELGDLVSQTIDDVIAKKSTFVDSCQGVVVSEQLQGQLAAAQEFATIVTARVPEIAEDIANGLSAPIIEALQRGVDEYADQTSLPDSCNDDSEPTSSAAPTESAAPTSTPVESVSVAPTSATPSGAVPTPTGTETCVPTTTTVTVTVPWTAPPHVPTGGLPSGTPIHPTYVTPTPSPPPHFTGAAVANGVTFGGFAAAGLAMLAVF